MRLQNTRVWTLLIAAAFLVLWCASVGVTYSAAPPEPIPDPGQVSYSQSRGIEVIGILGWCLVGIGFLGVALTVALGGKPKKRRKVVRVSGAPRHPAKVARSVYSPPPSHRYHRNVERRR